MHPDQFLRTAATIAEHCPAGARIVLAQPWSASMVAQMADNTDLDRLGGIYRSRQPRGCGHPPCWINMLFHNFAVRLHRLSSKSLEPIYRFGLTERASEYNIEPGIRSFDHHLSHAATACLTSPFQESRLCRD